jgi:muramoyltetrapeptide carboxypeptidase
MHTFKDQTGVSNLSLPKRVYAGCTVGVAAPAGPFDPGKLSEGLRALEAAGFRTHAPSDLFESRRYLAGPDRHRADTVNRLFADPGIDAVICARGGYGSMRVLSYLDFGLIAANPKPFIGFSDVSALVVALCNRCRLAAFHGPVVTTLGGAHPQSMADLLQAISSDTPVTIEAPLGRTIRAGKVTAPVSGGNLTTLCHLVGTPFEPQFRNQILFLEDCNEAAYRVDRMMSQMRLAGCLEGVAGIVLGAFDGCGPIEDIASIFSELEIPGHVPIFSGVDAGHGTSNITLPFGVAASLDAGAKTLTYQQAATVA